MFVSGGWRGWIGLPCWQTNYLFIQPLIVGACRSRRISINKMVERVVRVLWFASFSYLSSRVAVGSQKQWLLHFSRQDDASHFTCRSICCDSNVYGTWWGYEVSFNFALKTKNRNLRWWSRLASHRDCSYHSISCHFQQWMSDLTRATSPNTHLPN